MPNVHLSVIDRKYVHSATFGQLTNDVSAIIGLLRELTNDPEGKKSVRIRDRMDLIRIALQENLRWVVARDIDINSQNEPNIVGIAMVHWTELGTKVNAYIDDVVVSSKYQRQGIASKLTDELIKQAQLVSAKCIDLTSKPDREAANKLYIKKGFKLRNTNAYRLDL